MCANHKRKMVEVYVDDMLVNSRKENQHVAELPRVFEILNAHKMKMNPDKSAFTVGLGSS